MSDLVVIVYPTEAKAEEMRTKLVSLQKEYLIELGDAVIAVKQEDGKVKLNQLAQHHGNWGSVGWALGHSGRYDLSDAPLGSRNWRSFWRARLAH